MMAVIVSIAFQDSRIIHGQSIRTWLYVDDVLFQCPLQHVRALMAVVADTFAQFNLRLQRRKCGIHIAAPASIDVDD